MGVVANGIKINNAGGTISGGLANAGAGGQAYALLFESGHNFIGGAGQINGGIAVQNRAFFMPALPGTPLGLPLAINGPLAFAKTATYQIRVSTTTNDIASVTGVATLGGAKVFVKGAGQAPTSGMRYQILIASNGVAGRFSGATSNLAFFAPRLSYDANDVFLTARYNYALAGGTQNQRSVGVGLQNAARQGQSTTAQRIFVNLNQVTKTQAPTVLDSLSGEGITAAQNIANRSAALFTSSIFDQTTFYGPGPAGNSITLTEPQQGFTALAPDQTLSASRQVQPIRELADLPARGAPPVFVQPNRTWRAWATGFGGVDNIHGNGVIGSAYQQNTIYGGTLGVDYQLMPNYLVGVAVGGTNGDFLVPGRATSGSSTGGHIAIYDLATFGAFYGASSSSFSYFGNKTNRFVSGFGGLGNETERGNFNSNELRTRLEFGRHFASYGGVLTPFVALELAQLRSNGFTENAIQGTGLFRLNVSGQSQASAPAFVGLRLNKVTSIGNGITLSPTLQVAYVHEFAPYRSQIGTLADLPGSTFLVDGARPARNTAQVKAGVEMAMGPRSVIFANFDSELSGVNQLYAGKGGFRYVW